ncbi:serine O-acetyltransferase [Leptolyngbya sp. CCY15150]|uniref:serine O-acetyltransferase n=1 Tax=Leptolyngbya sp. CCY15150 TaxID=2767772 RepID=UPI00195121B8|nr:serine O-acetyltransferase [Leptolyngbya sp. CCY15150]
MVFSSPRHFLHHVQSTLPRLHRSLPLFDDIAIIFERDPAAHHWLEVLCCYPGLHAIAAHRLAHWLYQRNLRLLPRFMAHLSRFLTGIEIHPGAQIGRGVFIDHGLGVVIGETARVGDYSLIYQGVTLGGTGRDIGKRHPTVGSHVVIGAGAKILGPIAIGDYARIGAGAVVLRAVPAHYTAVGIPSRHVSRGNARTAPLDHAQLPDTDAASLRSLLDRIETLEAQLTHLQSHLQSSTLTHPSQTPLEVSS